jgi:hypothetical protein
MSFPVGNYDYKYKLKSAERLEVAANWLLERGRDKFEQVLVSKHIPPRNKFFALSGQIQQIWNNTSTPFDPIPKFDKITRRVLELMGAEPLEE